ncbi:MAG: hypothetical protein K6T83_06315 [Alicyclobacillus sp.]|nr:hypothetical protein [Alicyclobacillus sp.]
MDRLDVAVAHVDMNRFVLNPDGRLLQQTTQPELIYNMLRALDINTGDSVLEI